jgi:hypothetical protein
MYQIKTNQNQDFLQVNDKEKHIIIFSCHTNLKFLSTTSKIYVDGTFSHCTNFFKQVFTVHGYKNGPVPLMFALLTDKTAQSYEHCLQFVMSLCSVTICAYRNTYRFRKRNTSGRLPAHSQRG